MTEKVYKKRYGKSPTPNELAQVIGWTRERGLSVEQLAKVRAKMKKPNTNWNEGI